MPGLINKAKRTVLPLSASEITSCVRGYTLAMTASMTYNNMEDHPIEGIFVYPLEESSTVVGFEAVVSSQVITIQIKDKAKIDDCYFDCCSVANGALRTGSGRIVLDEDFERTVLVVNLGIIPPLETVTVLVSTSSELATLPNGAVKVTSPKVCTPKVQQSISEDHSSSPKLVGAKNRHHCAFGPHDHTSTSSPLCLAWLLEEEPVNSIDYEFNFQLNIRGPCLLAGVESPTHPIRADADPSARSATSIVITLADKYTYDCPVEILIYPSEPFRPLVLIEDGDMTPEQYEEHLKGKSDYIRMMKRDPADRKKVEVIRKRLHKDLLHNPVVMLNFCPDLKALASDLKSVQGEFVFLIDRSGSMSGVNISRVKEAMLVILKSLVPGCMFNIVGFGSTFRSLFPSSQNYGEETLGFACEYIKKLRADMGGTNILEPLKWILRQPPHSGHPRLLFLLTDGAVTNTGKVIELVRSHARYTRCYSYGIGQNACRRLLIGLSAVSKGTAEFLAEGERLQPKMIKSLKKSMVPVLSDIAIEWLVVCDTSRYHHNPQSEKRRRYCLMRANESAGSVFYQSQEEDPGKLLSESQSVQMDGQAPHLHDLYQEAATDDGKTLPRKRMYSTNWVGDSDTIKKAHSTSEPIPVPGKNHGWRTNTQTLNSHSHPDQGTQWAGQQGRSRTGSQKRSYDRRAEPNAGSQTGHQGTMGMDQFHSSVDSTSTVSYGELEVYAHQLCEVEIPQEPHPSDLSLANQSGQSCMAVITGLLCGKPMRWEVPFDFEPSQKGREPEKLQEDLWNETFHHLAALSIIRDFEQMGERECEMEHGLGRRYQLYAIHISKTCNILSKYTAFVPLDLETNEYLQTAIEYTSPEARRLTSHVRSSSGSQKRREYSIGLGRSQSLCMSDGAEDPPSTTGAEDASSPCSTPSSAGWERCDSPEAPHRNPSVSSVHSQRSSESTFSARLSLSRTRLLTRAARGFMSRSASKASGSISEGENDNTDYLPLVSLQLACGAFALNSALCEAISVPMEKLKWTSPFTSHRVSLTHGSHSSTHKVEGPNQWRRLPPPWEPPRSPLGSQADSGRGSGSEAPETPPATPSRLKSFAEPEGMVWGTAVALAWLEHCSADYFIEWELIAAKASAWLNSQPVPEGRDLATVKTAANQLFVILRHWDENLQLNMLCYNPNSV
ncbi:hypothetical protein GJAV_G00169470 [Gymnothorax javanicus]|nr:hypothetical protein GJAV_G00169470 [Gymnothorax javanicus]